MSATTRAPGDLVGRDFARVRAPGRLSARRVVWLVAIVFASALGLAALRIDILRVRYALGEAIREEKALVQRQRQQTAALEELRNPSRLVEVAHRLGFAPPERVIDLRGQASRSPQGREATAQRGEAERSVGPRAGGKGSEVHQGGANLR
jgi:hypothetical protein